MLKKILVTGATAVTGSALKAISSDYGDREFVFIGSKQCDLTNQEKTMKFIGDLKPDGIIHLAAVSGGIGLSMKHHASMLRDNTMMCFNILEAARLNSVKKTIMTLTTGMYPTHAPLPLKEEDIHNGEPHPTNYGSSYGKRICEPAVRAYRDEYGMDVIGLIPNGIFGPNDNFHPEHAPMLPANIRRIYEASKAGSAVEVWGDGSPLREYTFSEDVARAFMWALDNYSSSQVLNIGTNEELTIKEIVETIADAVGYDKSRIIFNTNKPNGIHKKSVDNSKFVKFSNFKYTPFRVGLQKTMNWFDKAMKDESSAVRAYSKSRL